MEAQIARLEQRIAQLEAKSQSHQRKFCRLYEVVYQILGSIYNTWSDRDIINNYWNYMVFNRHHDDNMDSIPTQGNYSSDSDIDTESEDESLS